MSEDTFELVTVKKLRDEHYNTGVMSIYYKNGKKCTEFDPDPDVDFYTTKLDCIDKYKGKHLVVMPMEDVEPVSCKYKDIYEQIVALQNDFDPEGAARNQSYINECRRAHMAPENLVMLNHTHGIDVDIVDHYIDKFFRRANGHIDSKKSNLRKGYFDIETDGRKRRKFVTTEEHDVPVNAISFFDRTTHTLVLRLLDCTGEEGVDYVENNPQIEAFKKDFEANRKKIEDEVNARQKKIFPDTELPHINVKIIFYSNDVDLITAHYTDIRDVYHIDFLMAFNQEYDLGFTFGRLRDERSYEYLCDVISDPAIPKEWRDCWYMGDFSAKEVSKKNDKYGISSPWSPQDMQYTYFKLRESMQKPEEYTLNYVLQTELDDTKVEYDCDICDFPYVDYSTFVLYSAIDTCGLYWVDVKTLDMDTMILLGNLSRTRTEKALTKTICLRNFISYFFRDECKLVVSNNICKIINKIALEKAKTGEYYNPEPELEPYLQALKNDAAKVKELSGETEEDEEESPAEQEDPEDTDTEEEKVSKVKKKSKFRGAFVADPKLLEHIGEEIFGIATSLIYDLVIDSDLSSLYPSIKMAWSIFVGTLFGKIYPKSNVLDENFSAKLADAIVSRDHLMIGKQYFDLPDAEELVEFFKKNDTEVIDEERSAH